MFMVKRCQYHGSLDISVIFLEIKEKHVTPLSFIYVHHVLQCHFKKFINHIYLAIGLRIEEGEINGEAQ